MSEGTAVDTISTFVASLDDAASALAEAVEAFEQAAGSAPKGEQSRLGRRLAGLAIATELAHSDAKRILGQAKRNPYTLFEREESE